MISKIPTPIQIRKNPKIVIAIPDIHGHIDCLLDLVEYLTGKYDLTSPDIQLVFLGDLINRDLSGMYQGSSRKCLEVALALQRNFAAVLIWGNHESSYFLEHERIDLDADLPDFGSPLFVRAKEAFVPYYETDSHFFVHAPIPRGIDPKTAPIHKLVWSFDRNVDRIDGRVQVAGHIFVRSAFISENLVLLDTGPWRGGPLTIAIVENGNLRTERIRNTTRHE